VPYGIQSNTVVARLFLGRRQHTGSIRVQAYAHLFVRRKKTDTHMTAHASDTSQYTHAAVGISKSLIDRWPWRKSKGGGLAASLGLWLPEHALAVNRWLWFAKLAAPSSTPVRRSHPLWDSVLSDQHQNLSLSTWRVCLGCLIFHFTTRRRPAQSPSIKRFIQSRTVS